MATYGESEDCLVTCPYDSTHLVKESRFQLHLAKCAKNHLDTPKNTCAFNARHKVDAGELSHHLLECNDRDCVDRRVIAPNTSYRGFDGVPPYHSQQNVTDENWDLELAAPSAYVPHLEPPKGGIRTDFAGLKTSQRKKYYDTLHHKDDEAAAGSETEPESSLHVLREPKSISIAQMLGQLKPVHELQNIGLGRGQPISAPTSKIAANIFGQQSTPIRQPRSSPHIPGFQIPTLGMGRGSQPVVNGDDSEIEGIPRVGGRGKDTVGPR